MKSRFLSALACLCLSQAAFSQNVHTFKGDVDGDGTLETLTVKYIREFQTVLTLTDASNKVLWTKDSDGGGIDLLDINGDGRDELMMQYGRGWPPTVHYFYSWSGGQMVELTSGRDFVWIRGQRVLKNLDLQSKSKFDGLLGDVRKDGKIIKGDIFYFFVGQTVSRPVSIRLTKEGMEYQWLGSWKEQGGTLILPKAFVEPLTESDLKGKDAKTLTLLRNEIFAVYGRKFQDAALRQYFANKRYYRPESANFKESDLTQVQRQNAQFIFNYQKANKLIW